MGSVGEEGSSYGIVVEEALVRKALGGSSGDAGAARRGGRRLWL
jgi:hypothetical protein